MVLGLSQNLLKKYIRKNQIRREKNALQSNVPKPPTEGSSIFKSNCAISLCVIFSLLFVGSRADYIAEPNIKK
jgi:hypothetical protein